MKKEFYLTQKTEKLPSNLFCVNHTNKKAISVCKACKAGLCRICQIANECNCGEQ